MATKAIATPQTLADVQVLLDRPRGPGLIVSCYADTSPVAGFQSQSTLRFGNEVSRVEQALGDDREALRQFHDDIAVIRAALERATPEGTRSLAVFSAAAAGFYEAFALYVPVRDCLVVDERPYLVPLFEALHRQRRYLVVLTDSHRGRLYAAAWGRSHVLQDIEAEVPRRQRSAGEVWGKQQATIARHREDHILHYEKALVRLIEQAWLDAPYRGLILLGPHETLADIRRHLPAYISRQIVYEAPQSWIAGQSEIDEAVRTALGEAMRGHDRRLVAEIEDRLREHAFVAAGPREVLSALENGQVAYPGYLVLSSDPGEVIARCSACRSFFTLGPAACPFCGRAPEKVNLWQEILLFAARHGVPTHFVDGGEELARHGGIVAVLSRESPWLPAPAVSVVRED